jgi:hypothetical protein
MRITLYIVLIIVMTIFAFPQNLDRSKWIDDIEQYQKGIETLHINPFSKISKEKFENEVNSLKRELNNLSDFEIIIELMKITRKIGDGHTAVSLRGQDVKFFPLEVMNFGDEWRIVKIDNSYKEFLGYKLIGINGFSIDEVINKMQNVVPYVENSQSQITRISDYINISEFLYGLGIIDSVSEASFTFQHDDGAKISFAINSVNRDYYLDNSNFNQFELIHPNIEKPEKPELDYFWFAPVMNTEALYIKFKSYPEYSKMDEICKSIYQYIENNKVKQVIIDMRNNGGGDYFVGVLLAFYLNLCDTIEWENGVYVISDKEVFSAATVNVIQYRQMLNAKIIGEPTGSNPKGYQDMDEFVLNNSKLIITYSKRFFKFTEENTDGVIPDVLIDYNWDDYYNGKDNMLEWIIEEIK